MTPLARLAAATFGVLLVLVLFSRFSMSESATGAHAKRQSRAVCEAALKRSQFYADASEQDESLALALLHACEARAHAQAGKDLAERTGLELAADWLALGEEQQDRVEQLLLQLQDFS